tara:strand:+ start:889 stop:1389 length:501 start_codon:yes stop_codon:yes gene_type:complete
MKEIFFKYKICLTSLILIPFIQSPSFSETASIQTGSSQRLSITLSNTMGVSTSADVTENLEVNNQANLVIEPGSTIQEEVGDETLSVTGDFVVTPTGSSLDIQGLQAKNNYIIGEGTYFFSEMNTVDDPNPEIATTGNASSNLVHSMTITIDQTNSSFTSSFSESF